MAPEILARIGTALTERSSKVELQGARRLKRFISQILKTEGKAWLFDVCADVYYPVNKLGHIGKAVTRQQIENQGTPRTDPCAMVLF